VYVRDGAILLICRIENNAHAVNDNYIEITAVWPLLRARRTRVDGGGGRGAAGGARGATGGPAIYGTPPARARGHFEL